MPPEDENEIETTPVELDSDSYALLERITVATERTAEILEQMNNSIETLSAQLGE
jgi:hypothetical protein